MRVVVLCHGLRVAGGRSVGVNVLSALRRVRPDVQYLITVPDLDAYRKLRLPDHAEVLWVRSDSPIRRLAFDSLHLPRIVDRFSPDVVWGLGNLGLATPPAPQALLIHKPQLVYSPAHRPGETLLGRLKNRQIHQRVINALKATSLVFCQTRVMRDRVHRHLDYAGRIEIMPNAVSNAVEPGAAPLPPELARCTSKISLLALTRYYPHKNLELIVDAFSRNRRDLRGIAVLLTIREDQHPGARRLLRRIRRESLSEQLMNVGPVGQNALAAYYQHTDGLLLPTLLESFTATYIEAMTFRKPILTSDLDFAHEVCDNAASYFSPWSTDALVAALIRFREDDRLRHCLAGRGEERLAKLASSWDVTVSEAMRCIESLI